MAVQTDAADIIARFGDKSTDPQVDTLFAALNTLRRPEFPDADEYRYHDWVLVKRKGVELGFSDSQYHAAAEYSTWGTGDLILTQAYFYSAFDDVKQFEGALPHGLTFADDRATVRKKLATYEATRHSYRTDTWDVDGYRLNVTYDEGDVGIDRMACLVLPAPVPREPEDVEFPTLTRLAGAFGDPLKADAIEALWPEGWDDDSLDDARDDGDLDLTESYGVTVFYAGKRKKRLLRSFTLHRDHDEDSTSWGGELPNGLDFEDSPETLFAKMQVPPVQQDAEGLAGYAVWHLDDYTMHVLYSNLYNRLLRVTLHAPGTWKPVGGIDELMEDD